MAKVILLNVAEIEGVNEKLDADFHGMVGATTAARVLLSKYARGEITFDYTDIRKHSGKTMNNKGGRKGATDEQPTV